MDVTRREALKITGGGLLVACLPGAACIQSHPATEAALTQECRSLTGLWGWLFSPTAYECKDTTCVEALKRVCAEVQDLPNHAESVRMYAKAVTHGVTTCIMGGLAAQHRGKIRARPPELTYSQAERICSFIRAGLRSKLAFPKPPLLPSAPLHDDKVEAELRCELTAVEDAVNEARRAQHGALDQEQLSCYRWRLEEISTKRRNLQELRASLTDLLD